MSSGHGSSQTAPQAPQSAEMADPATHSQHSNSEQSNAAARVRQAVHASTPPETLRTLARDPHIIVRAAVAINSGCGPEIDAILANDEDDRVRALLGSRIARLLPGLDHRNQDLAACHVLSTLLALARDQASRVRAAIADEIKAMDSAPYELVMLLARDAVVAVSEPILRLSPVLTDNDLLKLLATPPNARSAESIASRPKLSAVVADAIVAHAGEPAIRTLLANRSACIQEATLDALIGRAPHHTDWHAPLVRRPDLSANAIRALSEFIAADLLRVLAGRIDLDPAKLEAVRQRLACETVGGDDDALLLDAKRLKDRGNLSEELVIEAAKIGHSRRVAILLAVAASVPLRTVDRVIELRSAKAIVSLAWRGGFTMRGAVAAQSSLVHFSPDHLLRPTVNGGFPLSREEMEWQLELMDASEPPAITVSPA